MNKNFKAATQWALSPEIIEDIKTWEGYRDIAYKDAASPPIWTIGYGHTANVKQGHICTKYQAETWLLTDLEYAEKIIKKWVTTPINQGMYDALVSFVFNTGPGKKGEKDGLIWLKNGNHSTLYKKVQAGDFEGAALEFPKWTRAGTAHPRGLVMRRAKEAEYFTAKPQVPKDYVPKIQPDKPATILSILCDFFKGWGK